MASADARIEISTSNNYVFTIAKTDDVVVYTALSNQSILIGPLASTPALRMSNIDVFTGSNLIVPSQVSIGSTSNIGGSALNVIGNINFTGDLTKNGQVFQSGGGAGWSNTNSASNTIFTTSNLGIKTSTPAYELDVNGNINFTGNLTKNGQVFQSGAGFSNNISASNTIFTTSNVGIKTPSPAYELDVDGNINFTGNFTKNGQLFQSGVGFSNNSSTSNTIFTTSNLGIKTSTPSYDLDVNGDVAISGSLYMNNKTISFSKMLFTQPTDSNLANITTTLYMQGYSNENIYDFVTRTSNYARFTVSNIEALRISSNAVGILTSNPTYPLHVTGNIYGSADIIAFSDSNVKTDLEIIQNAISKIQNISGYTFSRKDMKDSKRYAGLLAQEVQQVLPEVVYSDNNNNLSVAYGNMAALFVEAIKELKMEIRDLKEIICQK